MKKCVSYILILLLVFLCVISLLLYLYQEKQENDHIQNIDLNSVVKTSIDEANNRPLTPIINLSEIENSGMVELDSKLYLSEGTYLDPKEIQIINDLKYITLCGETYRTKQIIKNNFDIIQRFAEILNKDKEKMDWYCERWAASAMITGGKINSGEEIRIFLARDVIGYGNALPVDVNLVDGTQKNIKIVPNLNPNGFVQYNFDISLGIGLTELPKDPLNGVVLGAGGTVYENELLFDSNDYSSHTP